MRFGYFLSCEEYTPAQLVEQAVAAERAGFDALWVSDHFHPWNDEQGESAFVWGIIGALSQVTTLPVTTAVTCPTVRIHPAIIAQAAATAAVQLEGRFTLGVGTGEALNEHVLGDVWPSAETRLEMLEEAVELMRALWTGDVVTWDGKHYETDTARIYTRPEQHAEVYVSAFGPKALEVAKRIGDGFITMQPDADSVKEFKDATGGKRHPRRGEGLLGRHRGGGRRHRPPPVGQPGPAGRAGPGAAEPAALRAGLELVTKEMLADSMVCGPDVDEHVQHLQEYVDAGFDEVYVADMGPHYLAMIEAYGRDVLPRLR